MKKYLYLPVIGALPLIAMTCDKERRFTARQLKPLLIECPDTVEAGKARRQNAEALHVAVIRRSHM